MDCLLDTNACIALINGKPSTVRTHFYQAVSDGKQILVPSVVAYELWYGVEKSTRRQQNAERLETFFSGPISVLVFDDEDARAAGMIRANLEKSGRPVGAYDILIAAQAVAKGLMVITANAREFGRIENLNWQDWAR